MNIFNVQGSDIKLLNDEDLRTLIGKLAEADLKQKGRAIAGLHYSGDQNAKDGGLDVYVETHGNEDDDSFIPRNMTGFQVKLPDMHPSAIKNEMSPDGKLRDSIKDIVKNKGAYIIVSSKSNVSYSALKKRLEAMKKEIAELDNYLCAKVDFYDCNKIAMWVGQYPEITLWFHDRIGKRTNGWRSCQDWSNTPHPQNETFFMDDALCMYKGGSPEEKFTVLNGINRIRLDLLKEKSCVRLAGLSGTGKTRLLYALFDTEIGENHLDKNKVIYCDLGGNPEPTALQMVERLFIENQDVILAVDNCSPEEHQAIKNICIKEGSLIKLITVEYDMREDSSENTFEYYLEPSSKESIKKVLRSHKNYLSENDIQLIADFSDGNYRVALALASTVDKGQELTGLNDEALFKRLFYQRNDENEKLLRVAETIALVYSFDSEFGSEEFAFLAELAEIEQRQFYRLIADLEKRGLVQTRGKWKALLPHAIANRLAKMALINIPEVILEEKFSVFHGRRIQSSFFHRLSYLHDSRIAISIVEKQLTSLINDTSTLNPYNSFWSISEYWAPVSPDMYLEFTEKILCDYGAEGLDKFYDFNCIRWIKDIADEIQYFGKALGVLTKIACSPSRKRKEAADAIRSIFGFRGGSVEINIEAKISIINELIDSSDLLKQDLSKRLISVMLCFYNGNDRHDRIFGAHRRNYRTNITVEECMQYCEATLDFVINLILQNNSAEFKRILAEQQRCFFNKHCIDIYIKKIEVMLCDTDFAEGWAPCLEFLQHCQENTEEDVIMKVKQLFEILKPHSLIQQIRAVVFSLAWKLGDYRLHLEGNSVGDNDESYLKDLGKELVNDLEVFEYILPELFQSSSSNCIVLGKGIAESAKNRSEIWQRLFQGYKCIQGYKEINILLGFIGGLAVIKNILCEQILDELCSDLEFQEWFIDLQMRATRSDQALERILKIISLGKFNERQCDLLALKHDFFPLEDSSFFEILNAISKQSNTIIILVHMLVYRMYSLMHDGIDYGEIADYAMDFIAIVSFDKIFEDYDFGKDEIASMVKLCLDTNRDYNNQIGVILQKTYSYIKDNYSSYKLEGMLQLLVKTHPRLLLDIFLPDSVELDEAVKECLKRRNHSSVTIMQSIPNEELGNWANKNPTIRYVKLAHLINLYENIEGKIQWTSFALQILNKSEKQQEIIKIYFDRFAKPGATIGSISESMRSKIPLYEYLLNMYDGKLEEWLLGQLEEYLKYIDELAEQEKKHEKQRVERFE